MDILFRSTRQHLLTVHIHPEAINIRPEILFFWINLYDLAKNTVFVRASKRLLLIKNSAMVSNLSTFRFCECVFVLSLHIHVLCFNGTERFQLQKNEHPITKGKFASASDISLQPNGEYVLTLDCDKALQQMIVE